MTTPSQFRDAVRSPNNPRIDPEEHLQRIESELDDIDSMLSDWESWTLKEVDDKTTSMRQWIKTCREEAQKVRRGVEQLHEDVANLEGALDEMAPYCTPTEDPNA